MLTFSTSSSNDPNVLPVVDVAAAQDDGELVNRLDFVNHSGVPLGSVVNPESVRKFGVRTREVRGFFYAPGREWRADRGEAPQGGVTPGEALPAPSNGNGG